MRPLLALGILAFSFLPLSGLASWDIYQSYIIIDSGSGNQYLAGGQNADGAGAFAGTNLGDFAASDALTLNGGELKTYKNGGSNVCGGHLQYRVYLSGDVAGSFSPVNLGYDSELGGGNQKWDEINAAIDLLNGLSPGDYLLEVYWDASGNENDPGGCGETKYDSDSGNNFTATFSILTDGSANTRINEFQPNPSGSDPSTVSVELIGGVPDESFDLWLLSIESDGVSGIVDRASNVTGNYDAEGRAVVSIDDLENPSHSVVLTTSFSGAVGVDLDPDNDLTVNTSILGTVLDAVGISDSNSDDDNLYGEVLGGTDINYNGTSEPFLVFRDATSGAWYALVETGGIVEAYDAAGDPVDLCGFSVTFSNSFESFGAQNPSWISANCAGCMDPSACNYDDTATIDDASCESLSCAGCMDPSACNYDDTASIPDASCESLSCAGCMDPSACNYDDTASIDDASCESLSCAGCMDPSACNYDDTASIPDASCESLSCAGCMDPSACNYDDTASIDDASCESLSCAGCMDPSACNYDDTASIPDTSCESLSCAGCMDPSACNYDDTASIDDASCESLSCAGCMDPSACNYDDTVSIPDASCESLSCAGCMDPSACNYDDTASIDDASCESLSCAGCMDPSACNYDDTASIPDASCESLSCAGCMDPSACNYDDTASIDDASCESLSCAGCMDPSACNYDDTASIDDASCESLSCAGCMDPSACNYDDAATIDDASCESLSCAGCTNPAYAEYDASATIDNGSCATLADLCAGALVLGSIEVDLSATTLTSEDGSATLTVTTGTPTSLTLTGLNGASDYSIDQPGAIDGIAAGYYQVTAIDADGCNSDTLKLMMTYSLCCDCGVSDIDTDGICDDEDNCTDRTASNYDDPSNADCSNAGCMDPAYTEYNASATTDDGSCSTLAPTCVPPTMDGHSYGVVEIGSQCWFSENLQTTVYADGSEIPEVTDNGDWIGLSTDARCTYDNDASPPEGYGKLYNWYAVDDERRLCPTGWHVPTDDEWTALETYLGANGHSGSEGAALKSTSGWTNSGNGTDDFGFSALPSGARGALNGNFVNAGNSGGWWSSTPTSSGGYRRSMHYLNPYLSKVGNHAVFGFSVRCLRDAE